MGESVGTRPRHTPHSTHEHEQSRRHLVLDNIE